MRAIDTNVLVRLLARDDARQTVAAERFIAQGAWVPLLALAETIWVLDSVYSLPPSSLARAVELLLDHKQLVLQDHAVVESALRHFRARPSLGFSDCLILAIAHAAGHSPLGTFDKNLARATGAERIA
ncbi:MAG: type II toxin-antitoxin system VapC family toxin [Bryobacteraceae bacterium]|nr:type II toxin-antitoxin system VapC family toxin [Bryobacteraceae bacterium]